MNQRTGSLNFHLWSLLALLVLISACAQPPPPRAPAPPPAVPPAGQVKGNRFINLKYRFFWQNPGNWKAVWPQDDDSFDFAWGHGDSQAFLWLIWKDSGLGDMGLDLAVAQGWEVQRFKDISWQGFPAWDAEIIQPGRAGRLRVVKGLKATIAVAALSPHGDQGKEAARLAGIIEDLHLIPLGDQMHVVRYPNESLSVIAKWYTDSGGTWRRIKEYNALLSNILIPGQVILIPEEMVVRFSPLPAWAVPPLPPKTEKKDERQPEGPEEEPGPEIRLRPIGPK